MTERERLLQTIREHPGCTARELGVYLGRKPSTLPLGPLQRGRLIRRTGTGWSRDPFRWYAVESQDPGAPTTVPHVRIIIHPDGRLEVTGLRVSDLAEFVLRMHPGPHTLHVTTEPNTPGVADGPDPAVSTQREVPQ